MVVLCSDDGYMWRKFLNGAKRPPARYFHQIRVLADQDGGVQVYAFTAFDAHEKIDLQIPGFYNVFRYVTRDGNRLSPGEAIAGYPYEVRPQSLSPVFTPGGVALLATRGDGTASEAMAQLSTETKRGWDHTGQACGVLTAPSTLAYHPRWGYLVANGPYVTRCKDLPAVLSRQAAMNPNSFLAKAATDPPRPTKQPTPEKKAPPLPQGRARYEPGLCSIWWRKDIVFRGDKEFYGAKACLGIVHPLALSVRREHEGLALSAALDANDPNSKSYNLLKLDFTGRNDYRHPTVVPLSSITKEFAAKRITSSFDSEDANCIVNGRRVRASIWGSYVMEDDTLSLTISLGTYAHGMCKFGGKSLEVRLYDMNNNLRADDKGRPGVMDSHDWLVVDTDSGAVSTYYGHPVPVDGELYVVTFSPDTMEISAKKYTGPSGMFQIDNNAWKVWLFGPDSLFSIEGGRKPVTIPVGKYMLNDYTEFADPNHTKRQHRLHCKGDLIRIDVQEGKTEKCKIGSPMVCKLTAAVTGRSVKFKYTWADVAGRNASITEPGSAFYVEPSIKVMNANGRPVDKIKMTWSWEDRAWLLDWRVREGLAGKFTATVECDAGPFITKPATATFTVK